MIAYTLFISDILTLVQFFFEAKDSILKTLWGDIIKRL